MNKNASLGLSLSTIGLQAHSRMRGARRRVCIDSFRMAGDCLVENCHKSFVYVEDTLVCRSKKSIVHCRILFGVIIANVDWVNPSAVQSKRSMVMSRT